MSSTLLTATRKLNYSLTPPAENYNRRRGDPYIRVDRGREIWSRTDSHCDGRENFRKQMWRSPKQNIGRIQRLMESNEVVELRVLGDKVQPCITSTSRQQANST